MLHSSRVVVTPAWRELLRVHRLDAVDAVYQCSAGQVITCSGSTEVRRVELETATGSVMPTGQMPPVVFVKKYWANRPRQLWSGMFRGTFFGRSKARREFENLARLRRWGLLAPEPAAYGEERRGRWLVRSFLISAGIPDPLPLDRFIRDHLPRPRRSDPEATGRRRALIDALAGATRRLHEHRFVHHDYFWRNIILSGERLDQFWLIDAHKGRIWSAAGERKARATDLAALDAPAPRYFSRTERLRFFLRYGGWARLDDGARDLLRTTLSLAAAQRAKQLQRVADSGRPHGR